MEQTDIRNIHTLDMYFQIMQNIAMPTKLKPAIDYFASLPSSYTLDEKGDKKIKDGA